jgi:hypothetical protein
MTIYKRALKVVLAKPLKLWGLSLLAIFLSGMLGSLCGIAIPLLGIAVGLLIGTAMTIIFLRGYRGEEVHILQLFECFKDWKTAKRVLLGMGWMWLWIFIWSLIPIAGPIFAIIRSYEYRLTPYILVLEPNVPITEAIKISSQKTNGYKLQMWLADFVYILIFYGVIIVLTLLGAIPYLGIIFLLADFVLMLAFCALAPLFAGLVQTAFYEEITGKRRSFCPNCGNEISGDTCFCPNCGNCIK